eukprot:6245751-Amphidinium_carterae.1
MNVFTGPKPDGSTCNLLFFGVCLHTFAQPHLISHVHLQQRALNYLCVWFEVNTNKIKLQGGMQMQSSFQIVRARAATRSIKDFET